jgi:hypothetical protein
MQMTTHLLSSAPGSGTNEDLIRVFEGDGLTDLLVLDGATSVADANYVDQQLYAQPLAAMTWIRIRRLSDHLALSLYCLGDCKAFAVEAGGAVLDLDPYVNPYEAVLQETMAALALEGVLDPALRRARLLPTLRARRESQHGAAAPNVLCLPPQGEFDARQLALRLPLDAAVLAMTDGFYRLVDPYGLITLDELGRRCRQEGLAPLMRALRDFETARAAASTMAVKSADDASAVIWTAPSHDFSLKDPT